MGTMQDAQAVPGRLFRLGEQPDPVDDEAELTPAERINAVWQVTKRAWAFSKRPLPAPGSTRRAGRLTRRPL